MNQREIDSNYKSAVALARDIARESLFGHIRGAPNPDDAVEDLAESIVGTESVVQLVVSIPFDGEAYRPVLLAAADEVGRLFFPDVHKRFISSLDAVSDQALVCDDAYSEYDEPLAENRIVERLPNELREYFDALVEHHGVDQLSSRLWSDADADVLVARVERLRRHFPDAVIPSCSDIDMDRDLADGEIRDVTRLVAAGITPAFPWGFFSRQTKKRVTVATEYLLRYEIRRTPEEVLGEGMMSLVALGLGPAIRRCGGSVNRLLAHAFPDEVRPWMSSHVPTGYWEDENHRRNAVRWLVEECIGVQPDAIAEAIHAGRITKKDFADAGLTWLVKEVYRWSVADALAEAYPTLEPWERLRRLPTEFWRVDDGGATAARAIRWALDRGEVGVDELRHQKASRTIAAALRPWKLVSAFSVGFDGDAFRCLDTLFPNTFRPWEVANVPRDDWKDAKLRQTALFWLLDRLGIDPSEIPPAIAQGRLTPASFTDNGLDGLLRVTGSVWRVVCDVFPDQFARWELGTVPRSHWRSRANVREAVLWAMKRLGISEQSLGSAIRDGRMTTNALVNLGLGSLIVGVFRGDVTAMCKVADVLPSESYVPLSRYYRQSASGQSADRGASRLDAARRRAQSDLMNESELDRHLSVSRSIREQRRRRTD